MSAAQRDGVIVPAFRIAVPDDWEVLDVAWLPDSERLAAVIDEPLGDPPLAARALEFVGAAMATERDAGVVFAAVRLGDDDGRSMAALTVSAVPAPSQDSVEDPDAIVADDAEVVVTLRQSQAPDRTEPEGEETLDEFVTTRVRLSGGLALRVEGVVAYPAGVAAERVYSVQYLVAPEGCDVVISLTAISAAIEDRDELGLLFDAIASTLEVDHPVVDKARQ